MTKKIKAYELHKLLFVADFPYTIDMREKAAQTVQLQKTIADIMAGLMANQVALVFNVSISKGKPNLGPTPGQMYNITLYWRQVDDPDMHVFKDLTLAKRCLVCADFKLPEGHVCNFQNQNENEEEDASEETLQ